MSSVNCPDCGEEFSKYGIPGHLYQSDCSHPDLSERQWEIMTGMVLGDGAIADNKCNNPGFRVTSVNRAYLGWLEREFNGLVNEITMTDEAGTKNLMNDFYQLRIRSNPNLMCVKGWSRDRSKLVAERELTPLTAKVWYAGDGSLGWTDYNPRVQIGVCDNERQITYIDLLEEAGFKAKQSIKDIYFVNGDGQRFLNWMGSPAPGFEYKWMTESRDRYNQLREDVYGHM